jgi:nucleoside-diphosphate-sugar epimerase
VVGFTADSVVLLTGASGFLGRHCLERLLTEPGRIHAVNRRGLGPGGNRVRWHAVELCDPAAAARLVAEIRPSHLLHVAWITTPGRFWTAPENLDWLEAGLALVRAFGEAGGRSFLGLGSCAEYDWQAQRFTEDDTPIRPATLYGKAKAAMWAAAEAFSARYDFCATWGRIFLPYGPGDSPERLIPMVIERLRQRGPVLLTAGTQERDFIYAPDAADLLVRLLEAQLPGAFNIATGRGVSVRRAVEYVADRIGGRRRLEFGAKPSLVEEPARLVGDMAKVEARLGWTARTTLKAGLDRVLALAGVD